MMQSMKPFQSLACHMRINLRRGNIGVPEQQLHDPQVGAMVEQVSCEGMAQCMRGQRLGYTGLARVAFDQIPESLACHG